jgi:hypothetical protein
MVGVCDAAAVFVWVGSGVAVSTAVVAGMSVLVGSGVTDARVPCALLPQAESAAAPAAANPVLKKCRLLKPLFLVPIKEIILVFI